MATVTFHSDFRDQEKKICHCSHSFPFYLSWSDGTRCHDLSFHLMLSFKSILSLSSFILIKMLFSSSLLSAIMWYHLHIWGCWYFSGNLDSGLWFIQCSISHNVLCMYTPLLYFSNFGPVSFLTVAPWPVYRFLMRQVRCSGTPIPLEYSMWSTQRL